MCFIQEMNPGYGLESDEIHHEADADELQIHSMLQRDGAGLSSVIPGWISASGKPQPPGVFSGTVLSWLR